MLVHTNLYLRVDNVCDPLAWTWLVYAPSALATHLLGGRRLPITKLAEIVVSIGFEP